MEEKPKNMEDLILEKGEGLFMKKGFALTSTGEIAREAGCNQALVHYYFRTKEKLYNAIFERKFQEFATAILPIFSRKEKTFPERIREFVSQHFDFLQKNPLLPTFIINELNLNTERRNLIIDRFKTLTGNLYQSLQQEMDEEYEAGHIARLRAIDLMLDIVLLNISVFLAQNLAAELYTHLAGDGDYFEDRKRENIEIILNRLKSNS